MVGISALPVGLAALPFGFAALPVGPAALHMLSCRSYSKVKKHGLVMYG